MRAGLGARLAELATTVYGNPDSLHFAGQSARQHLEDARLSMARVIGARPSEVVFTGGATEANVAALWALAGADEPLVAVGATEHPSVLETARALERDGRLRTVILPVDEHGAVELAALSEALTRGAVAIALMAANNETGVVTDTDAVAELVAAHGARWHCDAVQALGRLPLPTDGPTTLSLSAHKMGGPRGVGALRIVASQIPWRPLLTGGVQEGGRRAGTPDVAGAVLFAEAAAELAPQRRDLRDRLEAEICQRFPGALVNGGSAPRLPNTLSVCLRDLAGQWVDGEWVVLSLAERGVAVSTGAACSTGTGRPSHVLTAMGRTAEQAQASLRFSFGPGNTDDDVDLAIDALTEVLA